MRTKTYTLKVNKIVPNQGIFLSEQNQKNDIWHFRDKTPKVLLYSKDFYTWIKIFDKKADNLKNNNYSPMAWHSCETASCKLMGVVRRIQSIIKFDLAIYNQLR